MPEICDASMSRLKEVCRWMTLSVSCDLASSLSSLQPRAHLSHSAGALTSTKRYDYHSLTDSKSCLRLDLRTFAHRDGNCHKQRLSILAACHVLTNPRPINNLLCDIQVRKRSHAAAIRPHLDST